MKKITEIVIVGNGFGGTYTLKNLQKLFPKGKLAGNKVRLSLVGDNNYFLFTPLLHEVATGSIHPENIIEPIRKVFKNCLDEFHLGKVTLVNTKEKTVEITHKEENSSEGHYGVKHIPYDYLVLAGGAETNFYNTKGAEENCLTLKTLEDAIKIKNRIISQVEKASHLEDEATRQRVLTFVVVGGGPTGVELAAEMVELLKDSLRHYYSKNLIQKARVILVQKMPELLQQFAPNIRKKSLQVLKKKGIEVLLSTGATEISPMEITLDNGTKIATENVIWVAGIKPIDMKFDSSVSKLGDGKIVVRDTLQLEAHDNIFALGDLAAVKSGTSYLPALAQVATKEAKTVAKNIKLLALGQSPQNFTYKSTGSMVSLGQWMAIGEICSFTLSGRLTWWLWRTIYLSKMISWQKKLKIAIDWTIDIFSTRDISEL
jgi:NADH dehydrogenase